MQLYEIDLVLYFKCLMKPFKHRYILKQRLQDSHRTVFTFRSWLDLLGVVLAFWISILKISKLLQNCWHGVIDITSFGKHFESSLGHTLNFCRNLVIFRFKNMCQKESLTQSSTVILFTKLRRVKDTPNFISSGSKIVKRLRRRQYDPLIIERTIGIVLGPSTTLYRPFLKHCALTNKAVGTIWRALSKPPHRRQGPDRRPLWLLVGTPSAIRPELASRRAEHSLSYSVVTIYIFDISYVLPILYVYRFLWPLRLGWLLVCCLYREDFFYKFSIVCSFDYTAVAWSGKVGPLRIQYW